MGAVKPVVRSLRFKWGLTLVATSLVGIVLVGILAARVHSSEYHRFRDEEIKRVFVGAALDFYETYRSWDDIEQGLFPRRRYDRHHEQESPFVIADANGVIVKAAGAYQKGDMLDGSLQPTAARFDTLYQEAQLLNRLIDDLRTLSLADAGELKLVWCSVKPRDLLEQAASSFAPMAAAQSVTLQVDAEPDLPPVMLDPDRMAQVLENLVSNSLRFTAPDGRITLAAARRDDRLLLTVRDTGSGIPPEHLQNIFARFYRVSESRFQNRGESGLGLAIAESIVAAHGGQISAESELGRGTVIRIRLPLRAKPTGSSGAKRTVL